MVIFCKIDAGECFTGFDLEMPHQMKHTYATFTVNTQALQFISQACKPVKTLLHFVLKAQNSNFISIILWNYHEIITKAKLPWKTLPFNEKWIMKKVTTSLAFPTKVSLIRKSRYQQVRDLRLFFPQLKKYTPLQNTLRYIFPRAKKHPKLCDATAFALHC